jgi:hypothetical protein
MTTSSLTAMASAKKIVRREEYCLPLDVKVSAFDQGRCRLETLLLEGLVQAGWTQATRFADRS